MFRSGRAATGGGYGRIQQRRGLERMEPVRGPCAGPNFWDREQLLDFELVVRGVVVHELLYDI